MFARKPHAVASVHVVVKSWKTAITAEQARNVRFGWRCPLQSTSLSTASRRCSEQPKVTSDGCTSTAEFGVLAPPAILIRLLDFAPAPRYVQSSWGGSMPSFNDGRTGFDFPHRVCHQVRSMGTPDALVVIGRRGLEGRAGEESIAQDVEHGMLGLREAVPRANRAIDSLRIDQWCQLAIFETQRAELSD